MRRQRGHRLFLPTVDLMKVMKARSKKRNLPRIHALRSPSSFLLLARFSQLTTLNTTDAVEAVNKLSYYGLPGTSNSRVRNLIAYIGARHPLLAIFLGPPFDYYTRYRRVAGENTATPLP